MKKRQNQKSDIEQNEYLSSIWEFESEDEKVQMLETITEKNCGEKLQLIRKMSGISRKELADTLGVAESTIYRLEKSNTLPSNDFMLRLSALTVIGVSKFKKLNSKDKEKVSDALAAAGGAATGVAASIAAISSAGTIAGLSAAGITSGLAAIGGGTMLGGVAVVASIPVAMGAAGYGLIKGIKAICKANKLSCKEVDEYWELIPESSAETKDDTDKSE